MQLIQMICICLIFPLLFIGCTSTTIIKASSQAKIYADGKYLGEGSASYSDKKIVGSTTVIELKQEGYKDKVMSITRSGQLNPGALVGGILLSPTVVGLLFFLWVMDYNSYYVFELDKEAK